MAWNNPKQARDYFRDAYLRRNLGPNSPGYAEAEQAARDEEDAELQRIPALVKVEEELAAAEMEASRIAATARAKKERCSRLVERREALIQEVARLERAADIIAEIRAAFPRDDESLREALADQASNPTWLLDATQPLLLASWRGNLERLVCLETEKSIYAVAAVKNGEKKAAAHAELEAVEAELISMGEASAS